MRRRAEARSGRRRPCGRHHDELEDGALAENEAAGISRGQWGVHGADEHRQESRVVEATLRRDELGGENKRLSRSGTALWSRVRGGAGRGDGDAELGLLDDGEEGRGDRKGGAAAVGVEVAELPQAHPVAAVDGWRRSVALRVCAGTERERRPGSRRRTERPVRGEAVGRGGALGSQARRG